MDNKDCFLTIEYKGGFIHICENRDTGKTEVKTTIGYATNHHNTIIGAKRYISSINHYKSPINHAN